MIRKVSGTNRQLSASNARCRHMVGQPMISDDAVVTGDAAHGSTDIGDQIGDKIGESRTTLKGKWRAWRVIAD
jgi:hypothetical protein